MAQQTIEPTEQQKHDGWILFSVQMTEGGRQARLIVEHFATIEAADKVQQAIPHGQSRLVFGHVIY